MLLILTETVMVYVGQYSVLGLCTNNGIAFKYDNNTKNKYPSGLHVMDCASACFSDNECMYFYIGDFLECHPISVVLDSARVRKNYALYFKSKWPQRLWDHRPSTTLSEEMHKNHLKHATTDRNEALITPRSLVTTVPRKQIPEEKTKPPVQHSKKKWRPRNSKVTPKKTKRKYAARPPPSSLQRKRRVMEKSKLIKAQSTRMKPKVTKKKTKWKYMYGVKPQMNSRQRKKATQKKTKKKSSVRPPLNPRQRKRWLRAKCSRRRGYHFREFKDKRNRAEWLCLKYTHTLGKLYTWQDSDRLCKKDGARLAVGNTAMRYKVIKREIKYTDRPIETALIHSIKKLRVWVGMRGNRWIDGSPKTYLGFKSKRDVSGRYTQCISVDMKGKIVWKYENCKTKNFYICEVFLP